MSIDDTRLQRLLDEQEIHGVLHRYCRGVDRRRFDLVRSCYHDDAMDHHGPYVGGVDGFIEQLAGGMAGFVATMHFLGSIGVEIDGDAARSEAYLVAYHRLAPGDDGVQRDFVIGGRYVDDLERRDGEWRIVRRVCLVEWGRIDDVATDGEEILASFCRGRPDGDDAVFTSSLADHFVELTDGAGAFAAVNTKL